MARHRRRAALASLLIAAAACSGGGDVPKAGMFDVPSSKTTPRPATAGTVPAGRLKAPSAARMFAGSQSVVGQLTRFCKGPCMESPAGTPDFLNVPTGAFVLFTLGESPLEAVAEVRVGANEKPGTVSLSPGSLMVFNHGLGQGRYLVDLIVRWRSSDARWRFGMNVT